MMLFPGISQIQSALIGLALGALISGAGVGVVVYKIEHARYDRLVASQATAHAKALTDEAKASAVWSAKIAAANNRADDLAYQLVAERQRKNTVLHDTIISEGKKDAPLKQCLDRKLPDSILRNLAR